MQWIDFRTARPFGFTRTMSRPLPDTARITLGDHESRLLTDSALRCTGDPYRPAYGEEFIRLARRSATLFSEPTGLAVRHVLDEGFGGVLLENLPVDPELPATPSVGGPLRPGYKRTYVSEFLAVALGALIDAEVFNFRQEGHGRAPLFDNVVPVAALREQRGAGGYANNFPFHCESAWHRMRPDYLVLVGVRADQGARTLLASISDIARAGLAHTMPAGAYRLKPPDLYLQLHRAGMPLGTPMFNGMAPIGPDATINVNFNGTDCLGTPAVCWLAELEEFIEANAVGCVLGPGSALLMNNSRVCHTRTGYEPEFGATARWFLRANFKRGLWSGSRIV